jgi:putative AdoMet-dependent methyltransferase
MLNNHGFDLYSSNYDESVRQADKNNLYPFAGYNPIYGTIITITCKGV